MGPGASAVGRWSLLGPAPSNPRRGPGGRISGRTYPTGGRGCSGLGARVGGPACPAGSPFLPRNGEKEGRGQAPWTPGFYGPLRRSLVLGSLSLIRWRGYFVRYPNTDLGRIFPEKYAEKAFYERKSPNQGTYMGTVIAPPPGQCGTNAKTSEWERAGAIWGGGGTPRDFASGLSLEKAWIPARDRAGNHLAGANLRWSKPDHLPIRQAPRPLGPLLQHHQGHIRPVEQPETGELVPQPPGDHHLAVVQIVQAGGVGRPQLPLWGR